LKPIAKKLTLCAAFVLLLMPCCLAATKTSDTLTKRFLFAEWRHKDSTIVLGRFSPSGKHRIAQFTMPLALLQKSDVEKWLGHDRNGALLMLHCMWGQQEGFHLKKYLRSVDVILQNQPPGGIDTEISIVWHAGGPGYTRNWKRALAKGEPLAKLVGWMSEHYNGNFHALCHSMGARLFEGVVKALPAEQPAFKTITFFSADISNNTSEAEFVRCQQVAGKLYVYLHQRDRFLLLSGWMRGGHRLGRTMPTINNCTVIDMTAHISGLQNHTHIDKLWVQLRLREQWP
jgi:hypothetical protein